MGAAFSVKWRRKWITVVFSRVHAALHPTVSVRWSVGWSVTHLFFRRFSGSFRITAPAQSHATDSPAYTALLSVSLLPGWLDGQLVGRSKISKTAINRWVTWPPDHRRRIWCQQIYIIWSLLHHFPFQKHALLQKCYVFFTKFIVRKQWG